jgi:hypothetical protein
VAGIARALKNLSLSCRAIIFVMMNLMMMMMSPSTKENVFDDFLAHCVLGNLVKWLG